MVPLRLLLWGLWHPTCTPLKRLCRCSRNQQEQLQQFKVFWTVPKPLVLCLLTSPKPLNVLTLTGFWHYSEAKGRQLGSFVTRVLFYLNGGWLTKFKGDFCPVELSDKVLTWGDLSLFSSFALRWTLSFITSLLEPYSSGAVGSSIRGWYHLGRGCAGHKMDTESGPMLWWRPDSWICCWFPLLLP